MTAFAPATGMLTITLFGGGEITGKVTADTSIECDHGDYTVKALAARDEQESDDEEGEHNDGEHGDDEQGDDDEETDDGSVSDALQEGAIVQEAHLSSAARAPSSRRSSWCSNRCVALALRAAQTGRSPTSASYMLME